MGRNAPCLAPGELSSLPGALSPKYTETRSESSTTPKPLKMTTETKTETEAPDFDIWEPHPEKPGFIRYSGRRMAPIDWEKAMRAWLKSQGVCLGAFEYISCVYTLLPGGFPLDPARPCDVSVEIENGNESLLVSLLAVQRDRRGKIAHSASILTGKGFDRKQVWKLVFALTSYIES